jgi:hypothetical protein
MSRPGTTWSIDTWEPRLSSALTLQATSQMAATGRKTDGIRLFNWHRPGFRLNLSRFARHLEIGDSVFGRYLDGQWQFAAERLRDKDYKRTITTKWAATQSLPDICDGKRQCP